MSDDPTVGELEERYPDPVRRALFRLLNIVTVLRYSIIEKGYKVPPALHEAAKLTDYGQGVFELLRRRHVPYPEARLVCLLETYHEDLIVDVLETDQDALVTAINKQIRSRSLLYPFAFGRLLYDKYFDLFGDQERSFLSPEETGRFGGTPQGVFQVFDLVTGPYGLLESRMVRSLLHTVTSVFAIVRIGRAGQYIVSLWRRIEMLKLINSSNRYAKF